MLLWLTQSSPAIQIRGDGHSAAPVARPWPASLAILTSSACAEDVAQYSSPPFAPFNSNEMVSTMVCFPGLGPEELANSVYGSQESYLPILLQQSIREFGCSDSSTRILSINAP